MAIQQTPELERALQAAADRKASDLFLLPDEPISFRVKGQIARSEGDALCESDVRAIAIAAVGEERLSTLAEAGTIVTSCSLAGVIDEGLYWGLHPSPGCCGNADDDEDAVELRPQDGRGDRNDQPVVRAAAPHSC